ncbi:MAG: hypothetical protein BZY81_04955 [SAR202 cluster bacterium Io17-Chloro-G4]|nr:MAG: hypothetical protein BZY81_04955 [SAR202 cluster bacterium Io17-Chloro-G4]
MMFRWLKHPKAMILAPSALILVLIVACGGTSATAVPVATEAAAVVTAPEATSPAAQSVVATAIPEPTAIPAKLVAQGIRGGHVDMAVGRALRQRWLHESVLLNNGTGPIFNGVMEENPETSNPTDIRCDLCTTWELGDNGTTVVFRFQNGGVTWHDGTPFSAADLDTTIISMVDPFQFPHWEADQRGTSGWVGLRNYYDSHEVPDLNTLVIRSPFPNTAVALSLASQTAVVLADHIAQAGILQGGPLFSDMVGTGPFKAGIHEEDVKYTYTRYEDYWKEGLPYWDSMTQFVMTNAATVEAAYETEQILIGLGTPALSEQQIDGLLERMGDKMSFTTGEHDSARGLVMIASRTPFNDTRVRRAIFLALHRQPLIETLAPGGIALINAMPPDYAWAFTQEEVAQIPGFRELNGEKHPDDIAEARRLLADAGFPDGFEAELSARNAGGYPDLAILVGEQLEEFLNIRINLKVWESAAGYDCYNSQCTDMAVQSIGINIPNADGAIDAYRSGRFLDNWTLYVAPETDRLYSQQQQELDPEKQKALVQEWANNQMNDPIYANIWWKTARWLYNTKIQNFHGSDFEKWEHTWCEKDGVLAC